MINICREFTFDVYLSVILNSNGGIPMKELPRGYHFTFYIRKYISENVTKINNVQCNNFLTFSVC